MRATPWATHLGRSGPAIGPIRCRRTKVSVSTTSTARSRWASLPTRPSIVGREGRNSPPRPRVRLRASVHRRLGRSCPAPLCHAAQRLVRQWTDRRPHRQRNHAAAASGFSGAAPSREWGPTQDFFPFPLGQAIESDPPHSILGTIHASNTTIDPAPLPSCRLSLFHRACKRREGDKGTRQRSAGQDRGKNETRSKSAAEHARKETGRWKCPAHCESKRIVLASRPRADYARVMWTSRALRSACFAQGGLLRRELDSRFPPIGFRQLRQDVVERGPAIAPPH